jgi:hypothetical protein
MAHEKLKTLITNNIKTNGHNAITAQILQDVLIAMVDEYPDISGYATRTWVQQQDYAPKEWVQQQGYAKESALSDYLPLVGGTLTGAVNFTNTYGNGSIFVDSIDYDLNITASNMIYLDAVRGVGVNGNVTATSFIKSGGTSAQFLKADGSVDSNTYITASALTDYATKLWVTNQLGDYLPLDGGTLTGAVNFTNTYGNGSIFVDSVDHDLNITASNMIYLDAVRGVGVNGKITADAFEKSGGTSDEVLCADGSVKTLTELKAALNAI